MSTTPETERDTYEHAIEGQPPLVFHYAFNEGVEREVERGEGFVHCKIDGYHFAIEKITQSGLNVTNRVTEYMSQSEVDDLVDFIETCLCGPPVPWPPDDHEGNWF